MSFVQNDIKDADELAHPSWPQDCPDYALIGPYYVRALLRWRLRIVEAGIVTQQTVHDLPAQAEQAAHEFRPGIPTLSWKRCVSCGQLAFDPYMVKDDVWAASGLGPHGGQLHFTCLESRIKRPLRLDDFTDARINNGIRFGYLLATVR